MNHASPIKVMGSDGKLFCIMLDHLSQFWEETPVNAIPQMTVVIDGLPTKIQGDTEISLMAKISGATGGTTKMAHGFSSQELAALEHKIAMAASFVGHEVMQGVRAVEGAVENLIEPKKTADKSSTLPPEKMLLNIPGSPSAADIASGKAKAPDIAQTTKK